MITAKKYLAHRDITHFAQADDHTQEQLAARVKRSDPIWENGVEFVDMPRTKAPFAGGAAYWCLNGKH